VLISPPGDPSPGLLPEAGTPTPPGAVILSRRGPHPVTEPPPHWATWPSQLNVTRETSTKGQLGDAERRYGADHEYGLSRKVEDL
jgi:hypothetical protein